MLTNFQPALRTLLPMKNQDYMERDSFAKLDFFFYLVNEDVGIDGFQFVHTGKKKYLSERCGGVYEWKYLGIYFGEFNNANHQLESIGTKGIFAFLFTRLSFDICERRLYHDVCLFVSPNKHLPVNPFIPGPWVGSEIQVSKSAMESGVLYLRKWKTLTIVDYFQPASC